MSKFKKPQSITHTLLTSRIVQSILCVLIIALAFQVYDQYKTERLAYERRQATEIEYMELLKLRTQLEEQIRITGDEFGAETAIRRNFDVVKPGEEIVIIHPEALEMVPRRVLPSKTPNDN